MKLAKYKSDQAIEAGRITNMFRNEMTEGWTLTVSVPGQRREYKVMVTDDYISQNCPYEDGYFIRLANGEHHYMDKELFEQIYRSYIAAVQAT